MRISKVSTRHCALTSNSCFKDLCRVIFWKSVIQFTVHPNLYKEYIAEEEINACMHEHVIVLRRAYNNIVNSTPIYGNDLLPGQTTKMGKYTPENDLCGREGRGGEGRGGCIF